MNLITQPMSYIWAELERRHLDPPQPDPAIERLLDRLDELRKRERKIQDEKEEVESELDERRGAL